MADARLSPSWESHVAAPPLSQQSHPMYANMLPQPPQYYFSHHAYHSMQSPFQTSVNSIPSSTSSQADHYYNNPNDEGRGTRFYRDSASSQARTGLDAFSAFRRASG
ncbi:hypothetical protein BDN70DRAFT_881015 [Pholiota conissans]|uniref:Uncharacterized protein n=1 Tax=Pholiota conissans TaxID=109636 RepID=A0A9P6CZF3_9AGAR|nr:hypothetical protein BDN70DRAFT_881015 [Pholiota conissans]